MAEAVVVPTRFYCHMCNLEITIPNTDYTCPHCAGGFVEELPAAHSTPGASGNADNGAGSGSRSMSRLAGLEALRGEIATLLMSRNGANLEISIDPGTRRGNIVTLAGGSGGGSSSSGGNNSGGAVAGGRVRAQNLDRLDNVLLDFLQSISGVDGDMPFGNSSMFFMGNPGDYAWGREGIDTIVTQLLNQMETSGPPPLAKEKIAEIPKVEVTAEEVERKLQCSVCWEDFQLKEIVRKLPCSHIYHENCILPWLDLHGTCPICRQSLADDEVDTDGSNIEDADAAQSSNCPIHGARRNQNQNGSSSSSSNRANNDGGGTSQNQRNNVFAFDDSNVDLD